MVNLPEIIIQCISTSLSCSKPTHLKLPFSTVPRIVSHYNFFPLFSIYICPWTLCPLLGWATFSIGHFSVFDCMLLLPAAALWRTYFFPHQMPLYRYPACSWWCSHRASGSSVWTRQTRGLRWWPAGSVESWVTRREGSENPPRAGPPCGSAKERASDRSQHHIFTPPGLSRKRADPDSFSWPLPCPRAAGSASGLAPLALEVVSWDLRCSRQNRTLGACTPECLNLPACQLKSPPRKHSPQWGTGGATGKTGKCLWKLNLVLRMALCHIPAISPLGRPTVTAGCCPDTSQLGSLREAWTKARFVPSLLSLLLIEPLLLGWAFPPNQAGMEWRE